MSYQKNKTVPTTTSQERQITAKHVVHTCNSSTEELKQEDFVVS